MNKAKPLTEEQRQRIKSELHRRAVLALKAEREREAELPMSKIVGVIRNFLGVGFNVVTLEDFEASVGELTPAQIARLKVLLVSAGCRPLGREGFQIDGIDLGKLTRKE
jgi:hypothetical protein